MPHDFTVGSLFSGIGGLDLGLERAGMRVVWQCELDPYCRAVLAHHWPDVHAYGDVRDIGSAVPRVDLICGGFPCQPVSFAGKRLVQQDPRWLWPEFFRVVGELRPRYVLVENVPGLASAGLADVVGDLAAIGYDAEWDLVSAASVGAPHIRERLFVVAYPNGEWESQQEGAERQERGRAGDGSGEPGDVADADPFRRNGRPRYFTEANWRQELENRRSRNIQDPDSSALESWRVGGRATQASSAWWWAVEPDVGRVAHGVPHRLARLSALGNAVVPQVAEFVGRLIIEADSR